MALRTMSHVARKKLHIREGLFLTLEGYLFKKLQKLFQKSEGEHLLPPNTYFPQSGMLHKSVIKSYVAIEFMSNSKIERDNIASVGFILKMKHFTFVQ